MLDQCVVRGVSAASRLLRHWSPRFLGMVCTMRHPLDEVCDSNYVLLTTFRRDGTAVGSPLWAACDGDRLVLWTESRSYKVRRLRSNPAVIVQPCNHRGDPRGDPVNGRAELLDHTDTQWAKRLLASKYGVVGWLAIRWPWPSYFTPSREMLGDVLHLRRPDTVGIAVVPT